MAQFRRDLILWFIQIRSSTHAGQAFTDCIEKYWTGRGLGELPGLVCLEQRLPAFWVTFHFQFVTRNSAGCLCVGVFGHLRQLHVGGGGHQEEVRGDSGHIFHPSNFVVGVLDGTAGLLRLIKIFHVFYTIILWWVSSIIKLKQPVEDWSSTTMTSTTTEELFLHPSKCFLCILSAFPPISTAVHTV